MASSIVSALMIGRMSSSLIVVASAPTFVTGPIVGALADKYGAEWIEAPGLFLALPWIPLLILKSTLPGFILFYAFLSES